MTKNKTECNIAVTRGEAPGPRVPPPARAAEIMAFIVRLFWG